jgi:two-component system sensor histidine kinase KdpD
MTQRRQAPARWPAIRPPPWATQVLTWIAALGGPAALTALLVPLGASQKRDYVFLYLGLVAVLGVLRGFGPALVAAAASLLLVDYFFVPPIGSLSIADEQDVVNLMVFAATVVGIGLMGSMRGKRYCVRRL